MYYIYGVSVPSLLIESTDSMINAHNHHASILVQIRAMQAAAAAHLQGRLTPKGERRAVYVVMATLIWHEEIKIIAE